MVATCSRELNHRVKGISMSNFSEEEVKSLKNYGNAYALRTWYGNWNPQRDPKPESGNTVEGKRFLRMVYVDQAFKTEDPGPQQQQQQHLQQKNAGSGINLQPPPKQSATKQQDFFGGGDSGGGSGFESAADAFTAFDGSNQSSAQPKQQQDPFAAADNGTDLFGGASGNDVFGDAPPAQTTNSSTNDPFATANATSSHEQGSTDPFAAQNRTAATTGDPFASADGTAQHGQQSEPQQQQQQQQQQGNEQKQQQKKGSVR